MTEDDLFHQTKGAYLCLIHPVREDHIYREEIARVAAIASSVPEMLVAAMIKGAGWRERLLGLALAMAKKPEMFIEPMLQSLRDPRTVAIVPACAALAVYAQGGIFTMPESFSEMFDRSAFDGEVGWATDKAMRCAGLRADDVPGRGPNYGQVFEDHVEVFIWLSSA